MDIPPNIAEDRCGQERVRRRRLPHWEISGAFYFITFRLAGSLPAVVAEAWRSERGRVREEPEWSGSREEQASRAWLLDTKFDAQLDRGDTGPRYLSDPAVAALVADALRFFDGQRYALTAYVVMPNHLHTVLQPLLNPKVGAMWGLDSLLHSIKSYTAQESNKHLGRKGEFWQREYYDHLIRDERDWTRCVEYTLNNPVTAGLCEVPEAWPWSNAGEYSRP